MSALKDINLWEFLDSRNFNSTENLKELSVVLLQRQRHACKQLSPKDESFLMTKISSSKSLATVSLSVNLLYHRSGLHLDGLPRRTWQMPIVSRLLQYRWISQSPMGLKFCHHDNRSVVGNGDRKNQKDNTPIEFSHSCKGLYSFADMRGEYEEWLDELPEVEMEEEVEEIPFDVERPTLLG